MFVLYWFWFCAYKSKAKPHKKMLKLRGMNKCDYRKCIKCAYLRRGQTSAGTVIKVKKWGWRWRLKIRHESRGDCVCDAELRQSWDPPGGCLFSSSTPARGLGSGVIYTDRPPGSHWERPYITITLRSLQAHTHTCLFFYSCEDPSWHNAFSRLLLNLKGNSALVQIVCCSLAIVLIRNNKIVLAKLVAEIWGHGNIIKKRSDGARAEMVRWSDKFSTNPQVSQTYLEVYWVKLSYFTYLPSYHCKNIQFQVCWLLVFLQNKVVLKKPTRYPSWNKLEIFFKLIITLN